MIVDGMAPDVRHATPTGGAFTPRLQHGPWESSRLDGDLTNGDLSSGTSFAGQTILQQSQKGCYPWR